MFHLDLAHAPPPGFEDQNGHRHLSKISFRGTQQLEHSGTQRSPWYGFSDAHDNSAELRRIPPNVAETQVGRQQDGHPRPRLLVHPLIGYAP